MRRVCGTAGCTQKKKGQDDVCVVQLQNRNVKNICLRWQGALKGLDDVWPRCAWPSSATSLLHACMSACAACSRERSRSPPYSPARHSSSLSTQYLEPPPISPRISPALERGTTLESACQRSYGAASHCMTATHKARAHASARAGCTVSRLMRLRSACARKGTDKEVLAPGARRSAQSSHCL